MSQITFSPPFVRPSQVSEQLRSAGYAVLAPADVAAWAGCDLQALMALNADWSGLPPDEFLKDGGRYRRRRHSCFVVTGAEVQQVPHRPHWQPVEYNALHGGMQRLFAPMQDATVTTPVWNQLLRSLAGVSGEVFAHAAGAEPWYLEAHQFRIDTRDGIGRPTPEGAHRFRPVAGSFTSKRLLPSSHWPLTRAAVLSKLGSFNRARGVLWMSMFASYRCLMLSG